MKDENINTVLETLKVGNLEELYLEIGNGKYSPTTVIKIIFKEEEEEKQKHKKEESSDTGGSNVGCGSVLLCFLFLFFAIWFTMMVDSLLK